MSKSEAFVKTERFDPNKDKTRIRRPPNAFMIFGQQFRKVLANKFQDLSNKEISKLLGTEWRQMDGQTKNKYHKLADEAHRRHLQKHPGYYYSPLEARLRKAERKRKSKMSRINDYSEGLINGSIVGTFTGNRPFLFQPPMYPMVRPMFGPSIYPRLNFGQQFFRFRPNYSFGGMVPLGPFAASQTYSGGQIIKTIPSSHRLDSQNVAVNFESEPKGDEVEIGNNQTPFRHEGSDIALLSSLLPPMPNPNIEVTPVFQSDYSCDHKAMNDNEVTKMNNAVVQQELQLQQLFREELEAENQPSVDIQTQVISK